MKTIITLEGVPFEGFEHANFIGSLAKVYEDFDIPRENVSYSTKLYSKENRIIKRKLLNEDKLNKALKCLYDVEEYNEKVVQAISILETLKGA